MLRGMSSANIVCTLNLHGFVLEGAEAFRISWKFSSMPLPDGLGFHLSVNDWVLFRDAVWVVVGPFAELKLKLRVLRLGLTCLISLLGLYIAIHIIAIDKEVMSSDSSKIFVLATMVPLLLMLGLSLWTSRHTDARGQTCLKRLEFVCEGHLRTNIRFVPQKINKWWDLGIEVHLLQGSAAAAGQHASTGLPAAAAVHVAPIQSVPVDSSHLPSAIAEPVGISAATVIGRPVAQTHTCGELPGEVNSWKRPGECDGPSQPGTCQGEGKGAGGKAACREHK
eukprot:gnl/TRDRNA2_/TRDRNA2_165231_c0_seq2.p1 gnl/TRDRNA2_/TRDRNA2_165231_c0~~gnl/TRDRNA2_/TRDRNA2_165231_c0_seq2.p1  ORF type:complete len:280 (+),score=21.05 gnl/TRDRNA2_/TRDRNA2_165231_c0_seq2:64-903(+)